MTQRVGALRRSATQDRRGRFASLLLAGLALLGVGGASDGESSPRVELALVRPSGANDQPSGALRRDVWDTDGTVHAIVATNGRVYLGGSFTYVAAKGRKAAAIHTDTAAVDPEFPAIFGAAVHVILADGQGGFYVGGEFNEVGGWPRTNLVHILPNDAVDPGFQPDPDGAVRALAIGENTLYLGGDFSRIGGQARSRLAAIELSGAQVTAWDPVSDGRVSALLVSGDAVFVGGSFDQVGGARRQNIAALDLGTGTALPWNPGSYGVVRSMCLADDRLFIGGDFNRVGGQLRNGLASLNVITGAATDWNPDPVGGKVNVLRLQCTTVYVGGYFTNLGGWPRDRVGAVDMNTGKATAWNPKLDPVRGSNQLALVWDLAVQGDTVYLAGEFDHVNHQAQRDLAAVDATTGQLVTSQPAVNGGVSALAADSRKLVAGFFHAPGGAERHNLAALDELTGEVTDWDPGASDTVYALAASGNLVYAGGSFTTVGGEQRSRLAAIDGTTGALLAAWNPGANATVRALAMNGGTLYAGGSFNQVGGYSRGRLVAIDATTGQVAADWNPFADATVYALASVGNRLYVGGNFVTLAGQRRSRLAALEATSGRVLSPWPTNANGPVFALAVSNDRVYVGGQFTAIDSQERNYLAAMDVATGTLTDWNPDADAEVRCLAAKDDMIVAGGGFWTVGGELRLGCAAIDRNGALLEWNPGSSVDNRIHALCLAPGALYVGGEMPLQFRGAPSFHSFAAFPSVGAPVVERPPGDQEVRAGLSATFTVVAAGESPLTYQWQFHSTNLLGATSATLVIAAVDAADAGRYRVVISNARGTVTASASLTVLEPVHIRTQPQSQTVEPGDTVTLSVSADSRPPPRYQWRLNGVNIAGAVHPTLVLSNIQASSGGVYQVVVVGRIGAVASDPAMVLVTAASLPFSDALNDRGIITGLSGVGSGTNSSATHQTGEPQHAGKRGGKSVWLSWTAPANGIATWSTRGSSFDTLLAVYTNDAALSPVASMPSLVAVAADEDRGGFLTSETVFNAMGGGEYLIVVDGFAGTSGHIVLEWTLDTNTAPFPRITLQPLSQTVTNHGQAVFSVAVANDTAVQFQWFRDCWVLPGKTNATLTITNVRYADVGNYRVVVRNASDQPAESQFAALELGPDPDVLSHDKVEDLWPPPAGDRPGQGALPTTQVSPASASVPPGFLALAMGSVDSHTLDNFGAGTSPGEALHCGALGGRSKYMGLHAFQNGILVVDTSGSSVPTILAVYNADMVPIACDSGSAPNGVSWVRVPMVGNGDYLLVVDSVNGVQGAIRLNWKVGVLPGVEILPVAPVVYDGHALRLEVSASGSDPGGPPRYQWQHNGAVLAEATNAVFVLGTLRPEDAGEYGVTVENTFGATNLSVATVAIRHVKAELPPGGAWIRLWLPEVSLQESLSLEASTNAIHWERLGFYPSSDPLPYRDYPLSTQSWRFFRAVPMVR